MNPCPSLIPVGIIHTPYATLPECPRNIQPCTHQALIEVLPAYAQCLEHIEGASHLIILYWLSLADRTTLTCRSRRDGMFRGVFATRSPDRPNPIGFGVVPFISRSGLTLTTGGLDCLDGTPLLDIKPYFADNDAFPGATTHWQPATS